MSETPAPSDPQPSEPPQPYPTYPQSDPNSPYGQQAYPQPGASTGGGAPPMAQPETIKRAVLLMRVGAAWSLLGVLLTLLTLGSIRDSVRTKLLNDNNYSASNFDTAYHVAVAVVVVLALVGVALWLWMAWANGKGKSWARILSTIFGGLAVLSFVFSLSSSKTALGIVSGLVTIVLAALILFLLWRPESTKFYRSQSAKPVG